MLVSVSSWSITAGEVALQDCLRQGAGACSCYLIQQPPSLPSSLALFSLPPFQCPSFNYVVHTFALYISDVPPLLFVSLPTSLSKLEVFSSPCGARCFTRPPFAPLSWRACAGPAAAGGDGRTARGNGLCSYHRSGDGRGDRHSGFGVVCRSAAARWFPDRMNCAALLLSIFSTSI